MLQIEARSQAAAELAGNSSGLEEQFRLLEGSSDVDDELAKMKAQIGGAPPNQGQLPAGDKTSGSGSNSAVDAELEELRQQLNKM